MKTYLLLPALLLVTATSSFSNTTGTANQQSTNQTTSNQLSVPKVVDAKTNPGTFELDQNMDPITRTQVIANVKDYGNKVTDVRLQFAGVPMEIPLKQSKGTTWTADLNSDQLAQLAVSGKTMKYKANVIARNDKGQVGVSSDPVEVEVKAPEIQTG
jgi:hypothetical protein